MAAASTKPAMTTTTTSVTSSSQSTGVANNQSTAHSTNEVAAAIIAKYANYDTKSLKKKLSKAKEGSARYQELLAVVNLRRGKHTQATGQIMPTTAPVRGQKQSKGNDTNTTKSDGKKEDAPEAKKEVSHTSKTPNADAQKGSAPIVQTPPDSKDMSDTTKAQGQKENPPLSTYVPPKEKTVERYNEDSVFAKDVLLLALDATKIDLEGVAVKDARQCELYRMANSLRERYTVAEFGYVQRMRETKPDEYGNAKCQLDVHRNQLAIYAKQDLSTLVNERDTLRQKWTIAPLLALINIAIDGKMAPPPNETPQG